MIKLPDNFDWVDTSDQFFSKVLNDCLNGRDNLFISGKSGSGKSLIIKLLCAMKKNVIVLSTTGLTALNLSVDGIIAHTPHSFLHISPMEIIPQDDLLKTSRKLSESLKKCSLLVIDEVSMMSNQMFDFIVKKIVSIRKTMPRVILFGDPMQLPPVINMNNEIIRNYYQDNYQGKVMFFNSSSFSNFNFKTLFLRKSYRQQDEKFEKVLTDLGYGEYDEETLNYLNQRVMPLAKYSEEHKDFIQLCPTNSMVNKINAEYINNFKGKEVIYTAQTTGTFQDSKRTNDNIVKIKVGAQVICTSNSYTQKDENCHYRNGTIGTVLEAKPDYLIIEKENGATTKVIRSTINSYELFINSSGDIDYRATGSFNQIDAKVCKALTIHRSQGSSLDNAYICLNNFLPEGLVYVALSRLRTLKGMGLSRPITADMIRYNQESLDFFN